MAQRITLDREEAEDVVQETMIKMWNLRAEWQNIDSLEAYSLRICRNLAIDKTKRMSARHVSLDGQQEKGSERLGMISASSASNPEHQTIMRDKYEMVKKLIDALPEKQRSIIQLRDIEGKPYKEIAKILDVTEEQVKVYLFRARKTIKQKYIAADTYGL